MVKPRLLYIQDLLSWATQGVLLPGYALTPFVWEGYTERLTTVFSSMNILMEAILDLAVPTNDSLRDPNGKNTQGWATPG